MNLESKQNLRIAQLAMHTAIREKINSLHKEDKLNDFSNNNTDNVFNKQNSIRRSSSISRFRSFTISSDPLQPLANHSYIYSHNLPYSKHISNQSHPSNSTNRRCTPSSITSIIPLRPPPFHFCASRTCPSSLIYRKWHPHIRRRLPNMLFLVNHMAWTSRIVRISMEWATLPPEGSR